MNFVKILAASALVLLSTQGHVWAQAKASPRPPTTQPVPPPTEPLRPAVPLGLTRAQKLAAVDYQISWYEAQQRKGGYLILGGIGLAALAGLTLSGEEPNYVSYGLLNGVGVVLIAWGFNSRWEAQQYLLHLRVKRHDFTMLPMYVPDQGHAMGMALATRF